MNAEKLLELAARLDPAMYVDPSEDDIRSACYELRRYANLLSMPQWPQPRPELGLSTRGIAVGNDGWIYVLHVDGENWTSGAQLTPMTFGMLKRNMLRYGSAP